MNAILLSLRTFVAGLASFHEGRTWSCSMLQLKFTSSADLGPPFCESQKVRICHTGRQTTVKDRPYRMFECGEKPATSVLRVIRYKGWLTLCR